MFFCVCCIWRSRAMMMMHAVMFFLLSFVVVVVVVIVSYLVDYYLGYIQILSYAKKISFGVCCWFWQKLQVAWSCIMDVGCTWWCMWNMPHGFWWLLPWLQNAWRWLPSQYFHKSSTPNFIVSSSVCFCSFCRHINNSMLASLPFIMLLERVELGVCCFLMWKTVLYFAKLFGLVSFNL